MENFRTYFKLEIWRGNELLLGMSYDSEKEAIDSLNDSSNQKREPGCTLKALEVTETLKRSACGVDIVFEIEKKVLKELVVK